MKQVPFISIISGLFLCLCQPAFAQEPTPSTQALSDSALFSLNLEDLMNIQVVTASKTAESLASASSVISVITAKEIEQFGALNVGEVLDRATSMYIHGSFTLTDNLATIRGNATSNWPNHVLVLINGRPYRESYFGSNFMNINRSFPLAAIERIEIIRGPGSVLYGSGAFAGVINIILKKGDKPQTSVSSRVGSFSTLQTTVSLATPYKKLNLQTTLHFSQTGGWDMTARDETAIVRNRANTLDSIIGPARTQKAARQEAGATINAEYKGFTIAAYMGHTKFATMPNNARWIVQQNVLPTDAPVPFYFDNTRIFADLGYTRQITPFWNSMLNLTTNLNNFDSQSPIYKDVMLHTPSRDAVLEWFNMFKLHQKVNVVAGLTSSLLTGYQTLPLTNASGGAFADIRIRTNPDPLFSIPRYREIWYSAYTQAEYKPFSFLKLLAGVQANKVQDAPLDIQPRLAAVLTTKSGFSAKALYGGAFRAAAPGAEKAILIPNVLAGSTDLMPERITTAEFQLGYTTSSYEVYATYFNSNQKDLIIRTLPSNLINRTPGTPQFVNDLGTLASQGFEIESKTYFFNKRIALQSSFAHQTSEDAKGNKDYYGTPINMLKIGLAYEWKKAISLGVWNSYFGNGGNIKARFSSDNAPAGFIGTPTDANPKVTAFNYLSANLIFKINEIFGTSGPDMRFSFYGVNLLDAKVMYPEYVRRNMNSTPGRAGRNLYGSFSVLF